MSNLEGVKIAICTSDSREGTHEFLTKLSLDPLVDMVLCGDDKDSISKPNPHNALFICDKLGVSPEQTIMVGDTPADSIMGQTASLGLTVGVLSGIDITQIMLIVNCFYIDLILTIRVKDIVIQVIFFTKRSLLGALEAYEKFHF